jgi:hypothetical protein
MGFQLNLGRVRKHYRRPGARSAYKDNRRDDDDDHSTHRLKNQRYYHDSAPGNTGALVTVEDDSDDDKTPPETDHGARISGLEKNLANNETEVADVRARQDRSEARQDATEQWMARVDAMLHGGEIQQFENDTI